MKICFRRNYSRYSYNWTHLLSTIPYSNVEILSVKFGYSRRETEVQFPSYDTLLQIIEIINNSTQLKECYFLIQTEFRDFVSAIRHLRPNGPLIERFEVFEATSAEEQEDHKELLQIVKSNHYIGEIKGFDDWLDSAEDCSIEHHTIQMIGFLNRNGRIYMRESDNMPYANPKGVEVLIKSKDNLDATYFHLLENPELCNKEEILKNLESETKLPTQKKYRII